MRIAALALAAALALGACTPATDARPLPTATDPASAAPASSPSPDPVPTTLTWGPTHETWQQALADARALPLERVAAQVMVVDLASPDPAVASDLVRRHHVGGVILMGGSAPSAEAVATLTRAVADADDRDWPVWISTDEEGGSVARLRAAIPRLPSFMAAGAARDKDAVTAAYRGLGADLRDLGVGIDYAPVADVTIGTTDPTIRTRSAGDDPERVAETVVAAVEGFVSGGVAPVIKHFPGHGSVTVDSHTGLPVHGRSVAKLAETDLVPFARAIEAGAPAVMMGHIAVPQWGSGPATLEPDAYAYLREEMGFEGVAITDALNMAAVTEGRAPGEVAVEALAAGADVLVMPGDIEVAVRAVVRAVERGTLTRERLDEAAARSIALLRWQDALDPAPQEDGYARTLAAAGATVAARECEGPFVGETVRVTGGSDDAARALAGALESRGVPAGDGTSGVLLTSGSQTATADVVVSLGGPWGLEASTADAYVAMYGDSRAAIEALADVLTGASAPGGDWPVRMGEGLPATC
ncbi:beta-hexosaminidase [Demequina sediminis]|uniref:beta-N-acetylhexosaminidase n=1 Tax=Demequina sediminis TaxID=1930058 RepID=A0ABP9WJV5_9MICO